jgi:serine/threonine protein kinase
MSTYTSEPGTKLAGRYRLVNQISAGNGWTRWKAIDETLARPVTVLTFAPGFPRVREVVTAARAASRLTDPRLAQVFDVDDSGEAAYVVMEWLAGQTLTELLAEGPLDVGRAVSLVVEASQALAGAHAAGLAHLRLSPGSLRWTRSGGVKISGLGLDTALAGTPVTDDPAVTDTIGLGRLLYAALTGYWPSEEPGPLPPAPLSDGHVCTPRQVSADVPSPVDEVTCRALFQRPTRHGPPLTSPAALGDALASVAPPVPLPDPAPPVSASQQGSGYGESGYGPPSDNSRWSLPPDRRGGTTPQQYRQQRYASPERSTTTRALISVVIVLVLVAIGATAWVVSTNLNGSKGGSPQAGRSHNAGTTPSAAASVLLKPVGITTYNPAGDGDNTSQASQALAGNASNPWPTNFYLGYSKFGNDKPGNGTGLILNMGKDVSLSSVTVQFGSVCCTSFSVEIGSDNTQSQSAFGSFTTVATSTKGMGATTVPITSKATGQYVLIWLTNLPAKAGSSSEYQAFISQITLHGTTASG